MGFLSVKLRSAHSLVNEISVHVKEADSAGLLVHPNSLLINKGHNQYKEPKTDLT